MNPIRMISFGGLSSLPLYAASHIGAFAEAGLTVSHEVTPNSRAQMRALIDGECAVAVTAMDNVIAYADQENADLIAFMAWDNSDVALYVRPDLDAASLSGHTWAVDALGTGYAFVLRKVLHAAGVGQEEYRLESFGGNPARWKAVTEGAAVGCIFNPPFDLLAQKEGFRRFQGASDLLGSYQGTLMATSRSWAAEHPEALRALIQAVAAGRDWILAGGVRPELTALIERELKVPAETAVVLANNLLAGPYSISKGWGINLTGVRTVMELRREMAGLKNSDLNVENLVDRSYYDSAMQG